MVTPEEIGLSGPEAAAIPILDWNRDTLASLAELGRVNVDMGRRTLLGAAAYSVAALSIPEASWWAGMPDRASRRSAGGGLSVGRGDVDAVRDMILSFSRLDQRRGGGHARTTVVQ